MNALKLFFPDIRGVQLLLIFSLVSLSVSISVEFLLGFRPCRLCLVQRYIHALIALSVTISLLYHSSLPYLKIAQILLLISFAVATTHCLVQLGLIQDFCITSRAVTDIDSFKTLLKTTPIPCASISSKSLDLPPFYFKWDDFTLPIFSILN